MLSDGETDHSPVEPAMVPIEVVEVGFFIIIITGNENRLVACGDRQT